MRPRPAPNVAFSFALGRALCLVGLVGSTGWGGAAIDSGEHAAPAAAAWETQSVAGACAELSPHLDALPGQRLECDPAPAGCGSPFFADATRDLALTCAHPPSAPRPLAVGTYPAPQPHPGGSGRP